MKLLKQHDIDQEVIQYDYQSNEESDCIDENDKPMIEAGATFPNWNFFENALKKYELEIGFRAIKFWLELLDDIKFLTQECKLKTKAQCRYIAKKFPNQLLYDHNLYNAICQYKNQMGNQYENDTSDIVKWLIKQQEQEPRWAIYIEFEEVDNNLS
ncbi:21564_t:CDS:2 [Cetraspora pellucida]|uniref:21564_t:CDS:1 n=1 Tax=Cetraspora pellucida TaxID=1433469 RepID=A0A9N9B700_9GLOM|nr:21564_t:CDS:2 [Cetraspora pellucida]